MGGQMRGMGFRSTGRLRWTRLSVFVAYLMSPTVLLALSLLLFTGPCSATKTITYYYTDPLGSILSTTDSAGVTTSSVDYDPNGVQISGAGGSALGFTGHVQDGDIGLVYMQARYYDPETAHFVSIDPTSGGAGNYFKFNRYLYVSGNPFYSMDPDGRDEECSFACRSLRAYSDYTSGIGQAINDSGHGRGGPLGDMNTSDRIVTAQVYQDAADGADAMLPVADPLVSAIPGGDAVSCAIDSCGPVGWLIAVAGVMPGEGTAARGARLEFSQARNAALRWLEARGFKAAAPVWNRFPTEARRTRIIGRETEDGLVGYRIEFDSRSGAHINTYSPKEKMHFLFEGTEQTVKSLTDPFNR